ncbi:MAG: UDP-N-acetylmuramate--alanine ligase [Rhodobacteraceae bacterium]|nr:MAG: UDP-N-acetylmuramate--alanine ligase [Paracoccaceae bacterium]
MSLPVLCAVIWALTATGVAFLPMRWQFPPGIVLLIAAPVIIVMLGVQHGWLSALGGSAAFISMFRRPLRHYWCKWTGVSQ